MNAADKKLRRVLDKIDGIEALHEQINCLTAETKVLRQQIPEELRGHRILLRECPIGHPILVAENWATPSCYVCRAESMRVALLDVMRIVKCLNTPSVDDMVDIYELCWRAYYNTSHPTYDYPVTTSSEET